MSKPFDVLAALEAFWAKKLAVRRIGDMAIAIDVWRNVADSTRHSREFDVMSLAKARDQHDYVMSAFKGCYEPPAPDVLYLTINGVDIALTPEQTAQLTEAWSKPMGCPGPTLGVMPTTEGRNDDNA